MPGDPDWPSDNIWEGFDRLLDGRLLPTTPLASACYPGWPGYSSERCTVITSQWNNPNLHANHPTSIMVPLFEGRTCMPLGLNYTPACRFGAYPSYVVNASTVSHIQLAVNFARNLNLRLVVKNTGHDLTSKPTGAGSLSIWTHWMKEKLLIPDFISDSGYTGTAIKFGAGVQVREANEFAKQMGVSVVGGEAATVGLAGGFTAGGGHSPLSSLYGIAADQVLAINVVLANGRFVIATSKRNADIFWMLCGGGGSTIGIVTSVVVRAHPKLPTTVVAFNFTLADTPGEDAFWSALGSYLENIPRFVAAGAYAYFFVGMVPPEPGASASPNYYFRINSFLAPNMTVGETQELLSPWLDVLDEFGIRHNPWYNYADNYPDAWAIGFPPEQVEMNVIKVASRLMPRDVFEDDTLRHEMLVALQDAAGRGWAVAGFQLSGTGIAMPLPLDNSVLPAWRNTLAQIMIALPWSITASWSSILSQSTVLTQWMDVLREIAPESGVYMSEADPQEPNLQQAFYGDNYPRLYRLKQTYDPTGLFFALTAVGAEDWEVLVRDPVPGSWNNNGRLCPVFG